MLVHNIVTILTGILHFVQAYNVMISCCLLKSTSFSVFKIGFKDFQANVPKKELEEVYPLVKRVSNAIKAQRYIIAVLVSLKLSLINSEES